MFSFNPLKWFSKKPVARVVKEPTRVVTTKLPINLQKSLSATGRNPTRPLPVPPAPPKYRDVRPLGASRRTDDDDLVWLQPQVSSLYSGVVPFPESAPPAPEPYVSGGGGSFAGGGASGSWDAPSPPPPAPAPSYEAPAPSPSYDSSSYSSSSSSDYSSSSSDSSSSSSSYD